MGNVAALGVGATMGVASSVSQVAAQALESTFWCDVAIFCVSTDDSLA